MKSRKRLSSDDAGGLSGKRILVIVTGGIAAYKSVMLVRLLVQNGASVRVVMSRAATAFVTPLTFEVLSGHPVPIDMFARRTGGPSAPVEHVELATWAESVVVAPATADFLSKMAAGLGDELASTVLLAVRCPVLVAPAMNTAMWEHPAVRRSMETLRGDGRVFIEPGSGELACGDKGAGRMAEPDEIFRAIEHSFGKGSLAGARILVTAGRTEEDIDPVRYISNRSSGRMGFAIAAEAKRRGAEVSLIHGLVDLDPPHIDSVKKVRSAAEMKRAVMRALPRCDMLVMAAAVSDYVPSAKSPDKIKRSGEELVLRLRPAPDILAAVAGKRRKDQIVVGFALETADAEANAVRKIADKGCDYLVLNRVGRLTGFAVPTNQITIFKGKKKRFTSEVVPKEEAAAMLLDELETDGRLKKKRES